MRTNDFVTTEEVVAEVTEQLSDSDFTHGIGRSQYELYVHRVLEDMSLHMFFNKVTKDIFNWNCNGDGVIGIPKNLFNVKEVYLFNSSCDKERSNNGTCGDECCSECCKSKTCWSASVEAHWKRKYNKFGSTRIKTAKISPGNIDPVYSRRVSTDSSPIGTLVYYGVQNGEWCFSDSALCYQNMRIVANGFSSDNCTLPIVPRELRNVCVDTVTLKACAKLMVYFDEFKPMYQVYKLSLYGDGSVQNPGSQLKAERFIKSLDQKSRDDLFEYFGNIDIK